ncbi:MAG TPA: protein phosphatase 2C domain-containing protein [Ardenticatenaceae bacterium]
MRWIQSWVATAPSPTHPERNEDSLWVAAGGRAAAVIDGMGGYRRETAQGAIGGEHASALAARVLAEHLDGWDGSATLQETKAALRPVIEEVNRRIWEELNWGGNIPAEENAEGKPLDQLSVGAAMTVVALCDGGSRAVAGQHGDTHGYVLKEAGLIQITEDQDLLLWDRMQGRISEEDAARVSQIIDQFDGLNVSDEMDQRVMRYFFDRNIFGALGVAGQCPETGWSVIKLDAGDRLVLLSDGAYSNMNISELASLLAFPDDPADVVVDLAKQRGVLPRFPDVNNLAQPFNMRATQDDMTAVIVVVGEEAEVANAEGGTPAAEASIEQPPEAEPQPYASEAIAAPDGQVSEAIAAPESEASEAIAALDGQVSQPLDGPEPGTTVGDGVLPSDAPPPQ